MNLQDVSNNQKYLHDEYQAQIKIILKKKSFSLTQTDYLFFHFFFLKQFLMQYLFTKNWELFFLQKKKKLLKQLLFFSFENYLYILCPPN